MTLPFLVSLTLAAAADPVPIAVHLPARVVTQPGAVFMVRARTKAKSVRFFTASENAEVQGQPGGFTALCSFPEVGTFFLVAIAEGEEGPAAVAVCVIEVRDPFTPPPVPPVPPVPPGPQPDASLVAELRSAFGREAGPDKAGQVRALAGAFVWLSQKPGPLDTAKTMSDVYRQLRQAVDEAIPADALPLMRPVVSGHLKTRLPGDASAPADIPLCRSVFATVAASIGGAQ